jgi:hypothetical protein
MLPQEIILEKINDLPQNKLAEVIDFIDFLKEREKKQKKIERFRLISEFANENAETEFDIDLDLEKAGIENLLAVDK